MQLVKVNKKLLREMDVMLANSSKKRMLWSDLEEEDLIYPKTHCI